MIADLGKLALPERPSGNHALAIAPQLAAHDCVCRLAATSPVTGGQHARLAISVTLAGSFHARGRTGDALIGAGALLLKNPASELEYRHVDDGGDRSLVFEYDEPLLDEIGRSFGVRPRAFRRLAIPPAPRTAPAIALAHRALCSGDPDELRDAALAVAALAFGTEWAAERRARAPAWTHARRISRAVRYIQAHSAGDCSLDTLAAVAGFSVFHFARLFRALTGQTPRQLVIAARLRAAAAALHATATPITELSLDAGFADLSNFTTTFRRAFGVSPRTYRTRYGSFASQ